MPEASTDALRRSLGEAGLSKEAVDAAWPRWWTADAASSPSARAELRFALARKLGLSPKALVGDRVEFVWRDGARFKNLSGQSVGELSALQSFGVAFGRTLLRAIPGRESLVGLGPERLRAALLARAPDAVVDLEGLLSVCWRAGVPVVYLRVFPLAAKRMHAMVVGQGGRHAVLLGRDTSYPAPAAFALAHEIGHVALGHVPEASALVDIEDPATSRGRDEDEAEADRFALVALTGRPDPEVTTDRAEFSASQLARAVLLAGPRHRIEPGTLALCAGFSSGRWSAAVGALGHIYPGPAGIPAEVNRVAERLLDWDALDADSGDYLRAVMGLGEG